MSSAISFQGLSTNLPTDQLVAAIINQQSQPMLRMQAQQQANTTKVSALNTLSSDLQSLNSSLLTLTQTGFQTDSVTSTDSDNTYVSATASGAAAGQYEVTVKSLATRARLVTPQSMMPNTAIGTGTYTITDMSGKAFNVTLDSSNNTLAGLASAINAAKNGDTAINVNATLIQTGADGKSQLVLSANDTGQGTNGASSFSITAPAGSLLATSTPAQDAFTSTSSPLTLTQKLASGATVGDGSYQLTDAKGATATVTLSGGTAKLQDLADQINASGLALTASVQTNADATQQLVLTSTGGSQAFGVTVPAGSALEVPAATQNTLTSTAASNADFILNGVELHRSSNTVTDAVQGVSFTLKKAQTDLTSPTTLTVALDTGAASQAMQSVVSAYNQFYTDYKSRTTFTQNSDGSYTAGVFNMDMSVRQLVQEVSDKLMKGPANLSSATTPYTSPAAVGISTKADGTISLDTTAFTKALQKDPTSVMNIWGNSGTATSPLLTYLSSGSKTTNSPIGFTIGSANPDGTLTGTFTVTDTTGTKNYTLTSDTSGSFTGTSGTPLEGLVVKALAGATGSLTVTTGVSRLVRDLDNTLMDSNPGDIGGIINNLNQDNFNLQIQIDQQQNYLAQSKKSLEATYAQLETTVGQLQSAGQSLSSL
jgi:flagellar hook-associated protein 2